MDEPGLKEALAGVTRFPGVTLQALVDRWDGTAQWRTAKDALRYGELRLAWVGPAHVEGFVHSKKARWLFYFALVEVAVDGAVVHRCCCEASCVRLLRSRVPRLTRPPCSRTAP
jgi:hypothetical protein